MDKCGKAQDYYKGICWMNVQQAGCIKVAMCDNAWDYYKETIDMIVCHINVLILCQRDVRFLKKDTGAVHGSHQ